MICQVVKIQINRKDKMTKRLTLNAEKRKAIESVFQSHWTDNNKYMSGLQEAKEKYNQMRDKMLSSFHLTLKSGSQLALINSSR